MHRIFRVILKSILLYSKMGGVPKVRLNLNTTDTVPINYTNVIAAD
jgi:hypothetical protein